MGSMKWLILGLLFSLNADAALTRVTNASSYTPGARAVGLSIHSEFNNIVNWINGANVGRANQSSLSIQTAASTIQSTTTTNATTATSSISITTTGRPVFVGLKSGNTVHSGLKISSSTSTNIKAYIELYRDTTVVGAFSMGVTRNALESGFSVEYPVSGISTVDSGATAGAHTYFMKVYVFGTDVTLSFIGLVQIYAYEL